MVNKGVKDSLKEEKNKCTQLVKMDIDESSDEDEVFGIDRINLVDSKLHSQPSTGRRATTMKTFTPNNKNKCMMLNNFICIKNTKI